MNRQTHAGAMFCSQMAFAAVVQTIDCKKQKLMITNAKAGGNSAQLNLRDRTNGNKARTAKTARQTPNSTPRHSLGQSANSGLLTNKPFELQNSDAKTMNNRPFVASESELM
jgi:hypothetical protein